MRQVSWKRLWKHLKRIFSRVHVGCTSVGARTDIGTKGYVMKPEVGNKDHVWES